MSERDYEKEALEMGWTPEEEWKGDPDKWRPAQEFVERGETIIPILRNENKKLRADMAAMEMGLKAQIERIRQEAQDGAKRDYEQKVAALKQQQRQAVEEGDIEKFDQVDKQIGNLKEPQQTAQPQSNPVFEEWNKKNPWYAPDMNNIGDADRDMTIYAMGVAGDILKNEPNLEPNKLFERVEGQVKKTFAHKFENPNREKADVAGSGGPAPKSSGKKTWADLPQEAKAAYERTRKRFESKGFEYKKDDYVKAYFEE